MEAHASIEEIEARRAFRAISAEPVPEEALRRMLEAAALAPSCSNNQPWRFVAVTGQEALTALRASLSEGNAWARSASLIIAAMTKPSLDCRLDEGRDEALFGLGLACMNLMLQATREGLYAHPIGGFAPRKVRAALGIPEDFVVATLIICGRPGEIAALDERNRARESAPRERRPIEELAFRERWPSA